MVEHDQSTEKQIQAAQISKVYPETNSKFAPEKTLAKGDFIRLPFGIRHIFKAFCC